MKIKPMFAWYDLWIGAYVDMKEKCIYIMVLPTLGFTIGGRQMNTRRQREMSYEECSEASIDIRNPIWFLLDDWKNLMYWVYVVSILLICGFIGGV